MKTTNAFLLRGLLFTAGFHFSAYAQGTFQNLDFEGAQIVPISGSPSWIATTNALPGWTGFVGANQVSRITYNNPAIGSTWVNLEATNVFVLQGNYSITLQGGLSASAASISQTGLVAGSARSLQFEATGYVQAVPGSLVVSLGGQNVPLVALSTTARYTLYGGDVTAFAGLSEQLTFSALNGIDNYWTIDAIQFSNLGVPEPGFLGLSALGGLLVGWRILRGRR